MSKPKLVCQLEMVKAYADVPSQDNEGYVPDRGGFKCGFYAAWNLLMPLVDEEREEKVYELELKNSELELIASSLRAECLSLHKLNRGKSK